MAYIVVIVFLYLFIQMCIDAFAMESLHMKVLHIMVWFPALLLGLYYSLVFCLTRGEKRR